MPKPAKEQKNKNIKPPRVPKDMPRRELIANSKGNRIKSYYSAAAATAVALVRPNDSARHRRRYSSPFLRRLKTLLAVSARERRRGFDGNAFININFIRIYYYRVLSDRFGEGPASPASPAVSTDRRKSVYCYNSEKKLPVSRLRDDFTVDFVRGRSVFREDFPSDVISKKKKNEYQTI